MNGFTIAAYLDVPVSYLTESGLSAETWDVSTYASDFLTDVLPEGIASGYMLAVARKSEDTIGVIAVAAVAEEALREFGANVDSEEALTEDVVRFLSAELPEALAGGLSVDVLRKPEPDVAVPVPADVAVPVN